MRYNDGMARVTGSFDVTSTPEPPFDTANGVVLGRMLIDKQFRGPLEATGTVHMTYARTAVETSAGYVAVERITGTLEGRQGSFVVLHTGVTRGDEQDLTIAIVPDSGTGDLAGISGAMSIDVLDEGHRYTLTFALG